MLNMLFVKDRTGKSNFINRFTKSQNFLKLTQQLTKLLKMKSISQEHQRKLIHKRNYQ